MLKNLGGSFYEMRMRAGERGGGVQSDYADDLRHNRDKKYAD